MAMGRTFEFLSTNLMQKEYVTVKKGTAIPVTALGGPYSCEASRFPHLLESRLTDGREVVSLTRRPVAFFLPERFLILISVRG
jgi:hypothetical protein